MKYHRISRADSGFSLIEFVISIGILAALMALTTPFTINMYRRYQLIAERNIFTALLREAREMSLGGQGAASHGVYIDTSQYVLYEGTSYATRTTSKDQTFPRETNVTITGPTELAFAYLTGNTPSKSFTLTNSTKTTKIFINKQGRIDWN